MTYTKQAGGGVIRSDGAAIPEDPRNADWQKYLAWVSDGNEATDGPPPPNPRIAEIKQALSDLAGQKIDALTAAVLKGDKAALQALEDRAAALRTELASL